MEPPKNDKNKPKETMSWPIVLVLIAVAGYVGGPWLVPWLSGLNSNSVTEEDAYFYGACGAVMGNAELAIERGQINYQRGSFFNIYAKIESSFDAPITWSPQLFSVFKDGQRAGTQAGEMLGFGMDGYSLLVLDRCIEYSNKRF